MVIQVMHTIHHMCDKRKGGEPGDLKAKFTLLLLCLHEKYMLLQQFPIIVIVI